MPTTTTPTATVTITHAINLNPRLNPPQQLEVLHKLRDEAREEYKNAKMNFRILKRIGEWDSKHYNLMCGVLRAEHDKKMDEIFDKIREVKEKMNR